MQAPDSSKPDSPEPELASVCAAPHEQSSDHASDPVPTPITENRYPDCLFLDLKAEMLPESSEVSNPLPECRLQMTLNFNEAWHDLKLGRVKIGLRGGKLRLKLKNAIVPYNKRRLSKDLALSIQTAVEITQEEERANSDGLSSSTGTALALKGVDRFEHKESADITACQVSTKGSEDDLVWEFRIKAVDEPVMNGLLTDETLTYLQLIKHPAWLDSTFEVSIRDVWITDAEGIWPPDISLNKLAWLKREILSWWLEHRLRPYISRVILDLTVQQASYGGQS